MELKDIPFIQHRPNPELIQMLEAALANAKAGHMTYAVLIHDDAAGPMKVTWQGLATHVAVASATLGCEVAKATIIARHVHTT